MNVYRSRPLTYPWASFIYVCAIALAIACGRLAPAAILPEATLLMKISGCVLAAGGFCLMYWALVTLSRNHTALASMRATTRLVTCGPFRLCRNPSYLGYTLFTLGLGVALNDLWIVALAPIAAFLTHWSVVRREEEHLHARFGYEFERYCQRTRAWL